MRGLFILLLFCSPLLFAEDLSDVAPLYGNPFLSQPLKGKDLKNILAAREKAISVCLTCSGGQCFVDNRKADSARLLNACGTLFAKPKKFSRTEFIGPSNIYKAEIKYSIDKKGRGNVGEVKFECAWRDPELCRAGRLSVEQKSMMRKNIKKVLRNTRWEPLIVNGEPHDLVNLVLTEHYGAFANTAEYLFGLKPPEPKIVEQGTLEGKQNEVAREDKEIEEAEPQEAEAPVSDEKIALEKERLQNLIHGAICKPYRSEGEGFLKSELGSVDYLIDLNKGFAEIKNIYHPKDKVLKNAEIFERINPLKLIETNGKFHTFENDLSRLAEFGSKFPSGAVTAMREIKFRLSVSKKGPSFAKILVYASDEANTRQKEKAFREIFKIFGKPDDSGAMTRETLACGAAKNELEIRANNVNSDANYEYFPLYKGAAFYPRGARVRGIEGYCVTEYTVTKSGGVADIFVPDCGPVDGRGECRFRDACIDVAKRTYRYLPSQVNGEPVDSNGVKTRVTFEKAD